MICLGNINTYHLKFQGKTTFFLYLFFFCQLLKNKTEKRFVGFRPSLTIQGEVFDRRHWCCCLLTFQHFVCLVCVCAICGVKSSPRAPLILTLVYLMLLFFSSFFVLICLFVFVSLPSSLTRNSPSSATLEQYLNCILTLHTEFKLIKTKRRMYSQFRSLCGLEFQIHVYVNVCPWICNPCAQTTPGQCGLKIRGHGLQFHKFHDSRAQIINPTVQFIKCAHTKLRVFIFFSADSVDFCAVFDRELIILLLILCLIIIIIICLLASCFLENLSHLHTS